MARINSKKCRAEEKAKTASVAKRKCLEDTHQLPCPNCVAKNTAFILYGLPNFTESLKQDLANGLLVLGGCDWSSNQPKYYCNACKHEWGIFNFPAPNNNE